MCLLVSPSSCAVRVKGEVGSGSPLDIFWSFGVADLLKLAATASFVLVAVVSVYCIILDLRA